MVRFGKMTYPGADIVEEISKAKKKGFDYVEVGIEMPAFLEFNKEKSSILKQLSGFSYPPIGHTTWWYDLGSLFYDVRKGWLQQAKVDIKIANKLGIKLLNFHFMVFSKSLLQNKKSRKIILENYIRSLNELSKYAKKYDMILMLENGEEKFEDYKYVLDRVNKIKVHFDVGHANISGGLPTIKRFIYYFGDRVAHIHVHDNHGKHDEHLALGKGNINWKQVVYFLKKYGYDKTFTLEVFKSNKDLFKSLKYFKKLWYN